MASFALAATTHSSGAYAQRVCCSVCNRSYRNNDNYCLSRYRGYNAVQCRNNAYNAYSRCSRSCTWRC
jgi:hypothetical protein